VRILWVGKAPETGIAGDEVYDRQLIAALEAEGATIDRFHPRPVSRARQLAIFASTGLPHDRALFATDRNRESLRRAAMGHRMALASTEPFDALMLNLALPCIPILHNITGMALPQIVPGNAIASFAARRARRWEERVYRSRHFPPSPHCRNAT
jgi:hypothetical protein